MITRQGLLCFIDIIEKVHFGFDGLFLSFTTSGSSKVQCQWFIMSVLSCDISKVLPKLPKQELSKSKSCNLVNHWVELYFDKCHVLFIAIIKSGHLLSLGVDFNDLVTFKWLIWHSVILVGLDASWLGHLVRLCKVGWVK